MPFDHKASRESSFGFTLIELLVVIAIISLLASILLPSLKSAKDMAHSVNCQSSLKALGTGVWLYSQDNYESFPQWENMQPGKLWGDTFNLKNFLLPEYVESEDAFYCSSNTKETSWHFAIELNDMDYWYNNPPMRRFDIKIISDVPYAQQARLFWDINYIHTPASNHLPPHYGGINALCVDNHVMREIVPQGANYYIHIVGYGELGWKN